MPMKCDNVSISRNWIRLPHTDPNTTRPAAKRHPPPTIRPHSLTMASHRVVCVCRVVQCTAKEAVIESSIGWMRRREWRLFLLQTASNLCEQEMEENLIFYWCPRTTNLWLSDTSLECPTWLHTILCCGCLAMSSPGQNHQCVCESIIVPVWGR